MAYMALSHKFANTNQTAITLYSTGTAYAESAVVRSPGGSTLRIRTGASTVFSGHVFSVVWCTQREARIHAFLLRMRGYFCVCGAACCPCSAHNQQPLLNKGRPAKPKPSETSVEVALSKAKISFYSSLECRRSVGVSTAVHNNSLSKDCVIIFSSPLVAIIAA